MRSALFVFSAGLALSACTDVVATRSESLTGDPVTDCPVVDAHAIAGHEATFYRCAEQTLACGPDGYLIGYGARYVERFYRYTRPWMSPAGKQWIDNVLVCLQVSLRDRIDSATSCEDVRVRAFDSHPACYVDNGFCSLPWSDWLAVVATVDGTDWLSREAQRQVKTTAAACLHAWTGARSVQLTEHAADDDLRRAQ
jgi:hypothetical protein